jgi:hypothetical protein
MAIYATSPFQLIQEVPKMGYLHYCGLDDRFKLIYRHLKNEDIDLAINAVNETIVQIYLARGCDCDINFIDHTLKVLMTVLLDIYFEKIESAHNSIRDYHYNIIRMFDC